MDGNPFCVVPREGREGGRGREGPSKLSGGTLCARERGRVTHGGVVRGKNRIFRAAVEPSCGSGRSFISVFGAAARVFFCLHADQCFFVPLLGGGGGGVGGGGKRDEEGKEAKEKGGGRVWASETW